MIKSFLFVIGLIVSSQALGVEPDEMLDDPALEARARVISQDLRCVVCQNETIDDSNATLAQDMRRLVRQRITAGDTNEEVLAYMVDRYGDFVLLRPQVNAQTYLLWFGPVIVLVLGGVAVMRLMHRSKPKPAAASVDSLSQDEQDQLSRLLPDHKDVT